MPKKMLIVDDSAHVRTIMTYALEVDGFDISCASSAEEGFKKATENPPDLMLIDYKLPDRTGLDLAQDLNLDDRTKNIPLFMVTGTFDPTDHFESSCPAIKGVIAKPFTTDQLSKIIEPFL